MGKYTRTMAESLSMVSEVSNLDLMRKAAGGAMQTLKMKDGKVKMDSFTASGIMKVYDKVNAKNKKTIENMLATGRRADIMKLQKFAMSKVNAEYVPEELQEGTWKVPETRIDQMALRKVLRRPIKAKDAEKVMSQHIGDDELYDEFYELEKDDPNQDVRPLIRNRMKELGIKEEIELDERIDPADVDDDATDDDIKSADKNIMMQMRKVQSLRGRYAVEFMDGKKVKVDPKIAMAVQDKYMKMRRPAEKEMFQSKVARSYKDMLAALKESLEEARQEVRQLKDPKKEMMIKSKDSGVFVIDKKDFKKYQKKGFFQVESVDLDELSIADVRKGTAKAKKRQGRERRATGKTSTSTADLAARIKAKEEVELDEEMKYNFVVLDRLGKVVAFTSKEFDAKVHAERGHRMDSPSKGKGIVGRNSSSAYKLKKPMSQKKGDMMINKSFDIKPGDKKIFDKGFSVKEEVELDEGTFKDIITMKKGNVGVGVIANAANVKKMEKDGWKIEGVIEKGSKILHKDPKRIMKAIKGGDKLNIGEDDKGPLATVDEGKMSQIDQMMKDGKSAKEIAKAMKMKVKDVESLMGEGFSSDAQRRAAFASGYKEKGKKKKGESVLQKISQKIQERKNG